MRLQLAVKPTLVAELTDKLYGDNTYGDVGTAVQQQQQLHYCGDYRRTFNTFNHNNHAARLGCTYFIYIGIYVQNLNTVEDGIWVWRPQQDEGQAT